MATTPKKGGSNTEAHILDALYEVIAGRKHADPKTSYTARLFAEGIAKIAQKVGEESVETLIEALRDDRERLTEESADLLYHLLVLWAERDIAPEEVWRVLEKRRKA